MTKNINSLTQKFWSDGPMKIISDKNGKMLVPHLPIDQRLLQTANEPSNAVKWLLLAPDEKKCAIGLYTRASYEIALAFMKFINEDQKTAAPQFHLASPPNSLLAMLSIAQVSENNNKSYPTEEVKPLAQQLPVEAGFSSKLTKSAQKKAIYSICKNRVRSSNVRRIRKKNDDFRACPIDAKEKLVLIRKRGQT